MSIAAALAQATRGVPGPHYINAPDYRSPAFALRAPAASMIPGAHQTAAMIGRNAGRGPSMMPVPQRQPMMNPHAGAAGVRQVGSGYHAIGGDSGPRAPYFPSQLAPQIGGAGIAAHAVQPLHHAVAMQLATLAPHVHPFLAGMFAGMNNFAY